MEYIIQEIESAKLYELPSDYGDSTIKELTYNIIGAAIEVHNSLGKGFSENVYKNCLCIEFENKRIAFVREMKFDIMYKGIKIPHHYFADFIIQDKVVLEIKSHSILIEDHTKQIINYLAVSKCKVGLIINFGENTLKFKRVILSK